MGKKALVRNCRRCVGNRTDDARSIQLGIPAWCRLRTEMSPAKRRFGASNDAAMLASDESGPPQIGRW